MHFSKRWGYLSRAGVNDKSQLMRQIEKYAGAPPMHPHVLKLLRQAGFGAGREVRRCCLLKAYIHALRTAPCPNPLLRTAAHRPPADIFTSRVSNFLRYTPFEVQLAVLFLWQRACCCIARMHARSCPPAHFWRPCHPFRAPASHPARLPLLCPCTVLPIPGAAAGARPADGGRPGAVQRRAHLLRARHRAGAPQWRRRQRLPTEQLRRATSAGSARQRRKWRRPVAAASRRRQAGAACVLTPTLARVHGWHGWEDQACGRA